MVIEGYIPIEVESGGFIKRTRHSQFVSSPIRLFETQCRSHTAESPLHHDSYAICKEFSFRPNVSRVKWVFNMECVVRMTQILWVSLTRLITRHRFLSVTHEERGSFLLMFGSRPDSYFRRQRGVCTSSGFIKKDNHRFRHDCDADS